MNTAITRLDQMLYAWLAETEDAKFERAFQKYYDVAFTGLVRYLARRAGSTNMDFEQMAVDALLKFFCKAGRERREASASVRRALPGLEPLNVGPIHVRQVRSWTASVAAFRANAMSFRIVENGGMQDRDWKADIHSLAEAIPSLQRQGCHLLNTVRSAVARILHSEQPLPDDIEAEVADDESFGYSRMARFVTRIKREATENIAGAQALEAHHPGAVRFVESSWIVIEALPLLRVPTNGYLFEIAQSLYLDECKARGRQKRGGSGAADSGTLAATADHAGASAHPVVRMDLQEGVSESEESTSAEYSAPVTRLAVELAGSVDPISVRIGEEFCQQFYSYLCRPLQAAQHAYELASENGTASAERKRLDSIARKTERVIAVLSLRIEGHSQNEIAESLGISRNQVKYIVEQMQHTYEQFAAASARTAPRPSTFGATSHVQ